MSSSGVALDRQPPGRLPAGSAVKKVVEYAFLQLLLRGSIESDGAKRLRASPSGSSRPPGSGSSKGPAQAAGGFSPKLAADFSPGPIFCKFGQPRHCRSTVCGKRLDSFGRIAFARAQVSTALRVGGQANRVVRGIGRPGYFRINVVSRSSASGWRVSDRRPQAIAIRN